MFKRREEGFTLIELLVVIAVLGVLATVVLIAINPLQQLAKSRDSGRQSTVSQLGNALAAYATTNNGVYPAVGATWIGSAAGSLVAAGEISTVPTAITYSIAGTGAPACAGGGLQSNYCYKMTAPNAVVYTRLEANSNNSRCPAATPNAWQVWSSLDGRTGIVCFAAGGEPAVASYAGSYLP